MNHIIFWFSLRSQSWATVWPGQWVEAVRVQLLQAEGRHEEELDSSQTRLCAGRRGPAVHHLCSRRAVRHRDTGRVPVWPLDWVFHTGERKPEKNLTFSSPSFLLYRCIEIDNASVWRLALFLQKCNKISCQVEVGNSQFTWTDTNTLPYTNWADGEPTV